MTRLARVFLSAALTATIPACRDASLVSPRPVLIQGALRLETTRLVAELKDAKVETVGAWTFWRGTVDGYPVVVSRTRMGASHAAAATALAIERYQPIAIIHQGTAGGHDPTLRVGDIVIGTSAVSLAAFKTPHRIAGKGSSTLDWMPLDLVERHGDGDGDLHEGEITRIPGDSVLLEAARLAQRRDGTGRVVEGVIGSSDVWNEEIDRIARLRGAFGSSVEDMETAPAAQIAQLYDVPFLGIRVVSANITNGGDYEPRTGEVCQEFVLQVLRAYIPSLTR